MNNFAGRNLVIAIALSFFLCIADEELRHVKQRTKSEQKFVDNDDVRCGILMCLVSHKIKEIQDL